MTSVQFDFYELADKLKSVPGLDFRITEDSKPLTPYHAELEIIDPDGQVGIRVICDERNSGLVQRIPRVNDGRSVTFYLLHGRSGRRVMKRRSRALANNRPRDRLQEAGYVQKTMHKL